MRRSKGGVTSIMEFENRSGVWHFDGRTAETYYPKANRVEVIHVCKHGGASRFYSAGGSEPPRGNSQGHDLKLGDAEQLSGGPLPVSADA